MNRRKALKNLGISFSVITVTPSILSLLQSCQKSTSWNPVFFNKDQFLVISKLMEIIIPETDIPGSTSLKLPEFVDAYIEEVLDLNSQQRIKDGLSQFFKEVKLDTQQESISSVTINQWEMQLNNHLKEEKNKVLSTEIIQELRTLTVNAFKFSEYVGENVLAYSPIPGEQRGCVDLNETTGGKVWSLK